MISEPFNLFSIISKKLILLNPNYLELETSSRDLFEEDPSLQEIATYDFEKILSICEEYERDALALATIVQTIEEPFYDVWHDNIWRIDGNKYQIEFSGLNDEENILKTDLIILPRLSCNWSGRSTEHTHESGINILLNKLCVFERSKNKINKKYKIINHYLNPAYFKLLNHNNATFGASPISSKIKIDVHTFIDNDKNSTRRFDVKFPNIEECNLSKIVLNTLLVMDKKKVDIVVFPEMIGSKELDNFVCQSLSRNPLQNIKVIILPSYHRSVKSHKENNSLIISYDGEILFSQQKLISYTFKQDNVSYMEHISPGKGLHLFYMDGIGTGAVLICRTELESEIRTLLNDLQVKVIFCPSWSTGDHDFSLSILAEGEHDINTVWCNTCSAYTPEQLVKQAVCIISNFNRNKFANDSEVINALKYNKGNCNTKCDGTCGLIQLITPQSYEEQIED